VRDIALKQCKITLGQGHFEPLLHHRRASSRTVTTRGLWQNLLDHSTAATATSPPGWEWSVVPLEPPPVGIEGATIAGCESAVDNPRTCDTPGLPLLQATLAVLIPEWSAALRVAWGHRGQSEGTTHVSVTNRDPLKPA